MTKRFVIVLAVLAFSSSAHAQDPTPYVIYSPVHSLATLFTDLFGPQGLKVDSEATLPGEQPHTAHFNSDFQSNFDKFTTAIVGQLVTVPIPSPASGFTYELDPATGVFKRSTDSFGPILAERAETVGAGRVSFGFAFQRFHFQTVEGLDLDRVPAVFTHDNAQLLGGRQDVITTLNSIDATVAQYTTYLTIGITDRFDVSAAMKLVSNDLKVQSKATIQRLGTTNPLTHFFRQADGDIGNTRVFWAIGHASGLGDTTVRLKANLARDKSRGLATGLDIRLPTGDQMNLLGTGTAGLAPFVILSSSVHRVSPHLNASYQWNGQSILAGNPATGQSDEFPDQVAYSFGADVAMNSRVTLALDALGRYYVNAERLSQETFHALDAAGTPFPNIGFSRESFNAFSGSVGLKVNVAGRLLLDTNLLFALDDNGVRDRVVPLFSFEYAF
jgi:outer membrane putative beta-barrel porin/alpha-amylase